MILICKKCKTKLPEEANFCFHCGVAVGLTEEEKRERKAKSEQQLRSMTRIGNAIMEAQMQAQMQDGGMMDMMGMMGLDETRFPKTKEAELMRRREAYKMRMPHDVR